MEIKTTTAGSLKEGSYILFDNFACVIKGIQTSKTGKHGHAKCRIEAVGLIDGQKIIKIMPSSDKVEVPIIEKGTAQVLSIHDDMASVMDLESYETFEMKVPEELKDKIKEGVQVLYWIVSNQKIMKQIK